VGGTVSYFFSCTDESIRINDDFLFSLDLDDFGAAVRRTTMIYKSCNVPRFRS